LGAVKKHILIGVLVSLFATAAGVFLYLEYFSKESFSKTLEMIKAGGLYGKVLSLAAIPNLFIFFVFTKRREDNKAKGVLLTTILIALTTLILKFF
jgi:Na+-driven multidrug efflux pump